MRALFMLELKNIKKAYHAKIVLQGQSLLLDKGIYWVKGTNGSGKTTLLRMIAGLLPFEGDILYNAISQKRRPVDYRRQVGWAEAEPLYPNFLTGMDLLLFYKRIRKFSQKEIDKLIDLLRMSPYIDNTIDTYSAGMTKKLSIILAFIGDPALCILDEPLITLDSDSMAVLNSLILEKYRTLGTTFLMSSHQQLDIHLTSLGKELIISNQLVSFPYDAA